MLTLVLCLVCLTACSSKKQDVNSDITIKWEAGTMYFGDTAVELSEYKGYGATVMGGKGGLDYTFMLDNAKDVTNLTINAQEILEENMEKYKGKFWYTEYLGSILTMAKNMGGDDWMVVQCITQNQNPDMIAAYCSDYLDTVTLTNGQVYVDFGSFTLGTPYDTVIVRPDGALITGIIKVSDGYKDCNTPVSVFQNNKEYQLMKTSSSKYDYYMYDNKLIQVAAGFDISQYITFK